MTLYKTIHLGLAFVSTLIVSFTAVAASKSADSPVTYPANYTKDAPVIDGNVEATWDKATWREVPYLILGSAPKDQSDLSMRYKVVWTQQYLYILAEIKDDILSDTHPNPLNHYWDDDALEIFIDEDNSGGNHLFTYNAFAYHIALDNQVVDMGPFLTGADKKADKANIRTYPHHVQAQWKRDPSSPHNIYWEAKLAVYPDTYKDVYPKGEKPAQPVKLTTGKTMGFMMSYCDSDSSSGREHFIGDVDIPAVNGDKNRGYIDADVFGVLELIK